MRAPALTPRVNHVKKTLAEGGFVMGTNDLLKETRATSASGRLALIPWLATAVIAARANGLDIIDGVYNDFRDEEGFCAECEQGRCHDPLEPAERHDDSQHSCRGDCNRNRQGVAHRNRNQRPGDCGADRPTYRPRP